MSSKEILITDAGVVNVKKCFALRDFDENRILSREFFRNLNLPTDKTDKEILLSFKHSTIEETEKTMAELLKILQRLQDYFKKIKLHSERLKDLTKKFAVEFTENGEEKSKDRFRHAKTLTDWYDFFSRNIADLGGVIREEIDGMKNVIDSIFKKTFAERLRLARTQAGMTQKELAEKIGVNRPDLVLFETAKKVPSFFTLCKILRRTNFSLDELLTV